MTTDVSVDRREFGSSLMRMWERILDSLDSSGGHIFVMLLLLAIGVLMMVFTVPKGEDIAVGAFSALLMALKAVNSNHHRYTPDRDLVAPEAGSLTVTEVKKTSTTSTEPDK